MKNNGVVVISCGRDEMLKVSIPTVERYCGVHGLGLTIVTKAKYNIGVHNGYNYGTFEKFQCKEYFDKYDRILRLDSDIIITPNAPNIFDFVPEENIGVVNEDCGRRRQNRLDQITNVQNELGKIDSWVDGYFNSGVVVASKHHREIFNLSEKAEVLRIIILKMKLGPFKEQTLLNWRCRFAKVQFTPLFYKFNHMSMFTELGKDPYKSYFIHCAGPQSGKIEKMKADCEYFYGNINKK